MSIETIIKKDDLSEEASKRAMLELLSYLYIDRAEISIETPTTIDDHDRYVIKVYIPLTTEEANKIQEERLK